MVPGYSKLLVADLVMDDHNAPLRQSGLDIAMLSLHSGRRRTETESRQLLESAGFTVKKDLAAIWRLRWDYRSRGSCEG